MIIDELKHLLDNCKNEPAEFDQLVDEFRGDRDAAELLELLDSDNDELVRISVWILSEIRATKYDDETFRSRLRELTSHHSPAIRLYSLNALFPFLSPNVPESRELIARLQTDENEGVRLIADAAAKRLEIAQ